MGLQLIICVETNKKCNSDYIYIKSSIEKCYSIDLGTIKLSPVYLDGKGNYSSKKTLKSIDELSKQYKSTSKDNTNTVMYCIDCDEYDNRPEDMEFLDEVNDFCEKKGYRFVWFCKDIEQVYLGNRIPDNRKKNEAITFLKKKKIANVRIENLTAKRYQKGKSNLCAVLDDYLTRKH